MILIIVLGHISIQIMISWINVLKCDIYDVSVEKIYMPITLAACSEAWVSAA
jgi:hypothetical protein